MESAELLKEGLISSTSIHEGEDYAVSFRRFSYYNETRNNTEEQIEYEHENQHDNDKDTNQSRTTKIQTFIHLIKGNVGPGCLSLPWAFSQLGIPMGFIFTVLLALLTSYNSLSIMAVKRSNCDQRNITFGDLGEMAYGLKFRTYVDASLCAAQLAICTIYFSFIGQNISAVARTVSNHINTDGDNISQDNDRDHNDLFSLQNSRFIMTAIFPAVMFLSCLPNLRVLAPVTATGTVCLFIGFGLIGVVIGLNWEDQHTSSPDLSWSTFPLALSAILYSFEGINLNLSIESAMKTPADFEKVYILAMICVVFIFTLFSIICVRAFGEVENGSITAFLMLHDYEYNGDIWIFGANIIVSLSVLFTYPLQLFPCISTISQIQQRHRKQTDTQVSTFLNSHEQQSETEDLAVMTVPLNTEIEDTHDAFTDQSIYVSFGRARKNLGRTSFGSFSSLQNLQQGLMKRQTPLSEISNIEGDSSFMRAILVITTFIFALVIPNVQELISLAGALAGSSMALVIPPLIKLKFLPPNSDKSYLDRGKIICYVLVSIGIILGLGGTAATIYEIYESFVP